MVVRQPRPVPLARTDLASASKPQRRSAPEGRRGPKPAVSDADLLAAIRADLARSPWSGEGLRSCCLIRTAPEGRLWRRD